MPSSKQWQQSPAVAIALTAWVAVVATILPSFAFAKLDILGDTQGSKHTIVDAPLSVSAAVGSSDTVAQVQTEQARVTLMVHAPQGIRAGVAFDLGLHIQHTPGWHTYWKNPGDSGLPTRLEPLLPTGMQSTPLRWAVPHAVPIGELVNFGYESDVLLPMTVQVAANYQPPQDGLLLLEAHAYWLVCKEVCLPQEGRFLLELPVDTPLTAHAQMFHAARAALPAEPSDLSASSQPSAAELVATATAVVPAWAKKTMTAATDTITQIHPHPQTRPTVQYVTLSAKGLPADWHGQTLSVFPEQAQTWQHQQPVTQQWQADGSWQSVLPLQTDRLETVAAVAVVLSPLSPRSSLQPDAEAVAHMGAAANATTALASSIATTPSALRMVAELDTPLPPPARATAPKAQKSTQAAVGATHTAGIAGTADIVGVTNADNHLTLAAAMLFAFLGGMVLNLMPCVFPVLAIKALSFVQTTSPRQRVIGGIAYSVGVVLSFALLGGAVWLLRTAGSAVGWGFQLQSPWFVVALAVLFVLIALNLFGWFEVRNLLPAGLAAKKAKNATLDAFLSGVLAVAVASPCTAPLMGAALGYAMRVSALPALLVFVALGLGMALPYLLLACIPALARRLPQPGAWMEHFKQLMAFPMLMTVVWLLWVLGLQVSIHFSAVILLLLVCLAMTVWTLRLRSHLGRWLVIALAVATVVVPYRQLEEAFITPHRADSTGRSAAATSVPHANTETAQWQPWSVTLTDALQARQQAYFIDFTAAWCITCQYNKANVLSSPTVKRAFARANVQLLRADWTRQDPAISQALARLGRTGVPVYVLYQPATDAKPAQTLVLSEILDREELLTVLAAL